MSLEVQKLQNELTKGTIERNDLSLEVQKLQSELSKQKIGQANLELQIQALYNSRSWKITAPLRKVKKETIFLFSLLKLTFIKVLKYFVLILFRYAKIRKCGKRILQNHPKIRTLLRNIAFGRPTDDYTLKLPQILTDTLIDSTERLPENAQIIYRELNRLFIEKCHRRIQS